MSITGTTRLSKGFYLYMPADAQDTHIMKAHLRKHKVFHNIVSALENVAFNNSLGNRNHRSQHLVETPFQRFERTGTRKNKREYPQHRLEISIPAPSGSASSSLGETAREAISIHFRHRRKTIREERPPSTSATPYPNDRRAEVENRGRATK